MDGIMAIQYPENDDQKAASSGRDKNQLSVVGCEFAALLHRADTCQLDFYDDLHAYDSLCNAIFVQLISLTAQTTEALK